MIAMPFPSCMGRARYARLPSLLAALGACAVALAAPRAFAQPPEPGDIIVERQVMPRDAFQAVPKSSDPVMVRATTFPATTFDAAIATLVSDADLTSAHGSGGVSALTGGNNSPASLDAIGKLVGGAATGSNVAMGPGGLPQMVPASGIGATISMSVTGALAPLSTAFGGAR
jgi:hypothetical protein